MWPLYTSFTVDFENGNNRHHVVTRNVWSIFGFGFDDI